MKSIAAPLVLLTIACNASALGLNPFTWKTHHHHKAPDPQVIEIVRWRQPVCLQPAPGVSSCLLDLRRLQTRYEQARGKGGVEAREEYSVFTESMDSSSEEEERDEIIEKHGTPDRTGALPHDYLQSSQTDEFVTETLSESSRKTVTLTEEQERNVRDGRYLVPPVETLINTRQQIYVTKVVDSPVTATLVAYNCLPDIGVPLCETQQNVVRPSAPGFAWRPTVTVAVSQEAHENRPAGVWQIVKEPLRSEAYLGGVRKGEVHESGSKVAVKKPDSTEPVQGQSGLQHIEISNDDKAVVSRVVGDPEAPDGSRLPANVNPLNGEKQAGQATKQEINAKLIGNADKAKGDSKIAKETTGQDTSSTGQGHPILQAIHGFAEKTENSDIVKRIQSFLHGSDDDDDEDNDKIEEPGVAAFLNKLRPANLFDSEEQLDARAKSSESGAEVPAKTPAGVSTDVEPEISREVQAGLLDRPEISATAKPRITADFNAILAPNVDSATIEDAKQRTSVEVSPESFEKVQPEVAVDAEPEIAADIKTGLSTNEKPVISEVAGPKTSMEMRPEFVKMLPETSAAAKVAADQSTGVESRLSADAESAVPAGIRTESSADAKADISTPVIPGVPQPAREEGADVALDTKTLLPVRKIGPVSDGEIDVKTIEMAGEADKGTEKVTKVFDKSRIDEKTRDIAYERPVENQTMLAGLSPNPVKLLKNENEK